MKIKLKCLCLLTKAGIKLTKNKLTKNVTKTNTFFFFKYENQIIIRCQNVQLWLHEFHLSSNENEEQIQVQRFTSFLDCKRKCIQPSLHASLLPSI